MKLQFVTSSMQMQKLAGEAEVPYGIIGCCEINKHSTSLLFMQKALLDALSQESDLIYVDLPCHKPAFSLARGGSIMDSTSTWA